MCIWRGRQFVPHHIHGGQKTARRSWFFPFTMFVQGENSGIRLGRKHLYSLNHLVSPRASAFCLIPFSSTRAPGMLLSHISDFPAWAGVLELRLDRPYIQLDKLPFLHSSSSLDQSIFNSDYPPLWCPCHTSPQLCMTGHIQAYWAPSRSHFPNTHF